MKVGIPRGLFFYYYYPLWKTFFTDLDVQVVTSDASSRQTMDEGIRLAVDEACLPVKVYFGHVSELCGQDLDYLFVPRLVSVEARSYICPKFMGIPDMIRAAAISDLPQLIDITVDLSRSSHNLRQDIVRIGQLFTSSRRQINRAYQHGLAENRYCRLLAAQGYTLDEAVRQWEGEPPAPFRDDGDLNIGVLGHGYSLYDESISMSLVKRLRAMKCRVYLLESLPSATIEKEAATLPKRMFWTLGRKLIGSALYLDQREDIDGIIYLACFGCGPDSMIGEVVERKVKHKPFMMLTVDEHTGEGGMITRLEAFCDMLRRRRMGGESNFPTHGQCLYSD